jgi:Asp-tRNA(Asn)/Glu-tRNA(Gln) amidotransferase A subunit family amidase
MTEPLTITDASPLIKSGELTPSDLFEQCLRRVDQYEPAVRAWVYLDRERARLEAATFTEEIKKGLYRGPLHGIPIGIKDIIDVYDMPTGCGSKLWANSYARTDATCVARLRQAGAVIMGKTVTTPYAYLDPPVTRNPWNLERTPGGSSSGSAAAVACAMCLGALGTQTGGSLTRPAAYCGVCSLKPSFRRVSTAGVLPLAPELDHVGVMANCVRDLAILFQTIAGYDAESEITLVGSVPDCVSKIDKLIALMPDFVHYDDKPHLRPRFLRPAEMYPDRLHPDVKQFVNRVERDIRSLAHSDTAIDSVVLPPIFGQIHQAHRVLMAAGAANVHRSRFKRLPNDYPARIAELIEQGASLTASAVSEAQSVRLRFEEQMDYQWWSHPLMTPATLDPAPSADSTGDAWCNSPWSFLGLPTVSVPLGQSSGGLPLSVQFVLGDGRESQLLAAVARLEHVFRIDKPREKRTIPPVPVPV